MFLYILFSVLVNPIAPKTAHEYYLSTTEITWDAKNQTLEMSITCVGHDVERWFEKKKQQKLSLESADKPMVTERLNTILDEQFLVKVGDTPIPIVLVGYQLNKNDQLDIFITCKLPGNTQSFSITNTLLTDLYMFQENIMHFKDPKTQSTQSAYCTKRKPEAIFHLKQ
jgi:hypothetical protein